MLEDDAQTNSGGRPFRAGFFGCLGVAAAVCVVLAFLVGIYFFHNPASSVAGKLQETNAETAQAHAIMAEMSKPPMWAVTYGSSKIDDFRTVMARLMATGTYESSVGLEVHPSLNVQCFEHKTAVYVDADSYVSGYDGIPAVIRIDGGTPRRERWLELRDHEGAFSPLARKFMIRVATAHQIVVRLEPAFQNTMTFTFDVNVPKATIAQVAQTCGEKTD